MFLFIWQLQYVCMYIFIYKYYIQVYYLFSIVLDLDLLATSLTIGPILCYLSSMSHFCSSFIKL